MKFSKQEILRVITLSSVVAMLSACGGATPPPKPYNPTLGATAQADSFIQESNTEYLKSVKKVAITACNVMFAERTSASASTSAGLFHHDRGERAEARVSVVYSLDGLSNSDKQALTDKYCSHGKRKLEQAGFEVISDASMKKLDPYKKMLNSGQETPYQYKLGPATYQVFTKSGSTLFDKRYQTGASGLGQVISSFSGESVEQLEALSLDTGKVSGVNINLLVDFATLTSSGDEEKIIGRSDTAKVSSKVQLSVSGNIIFLPMSELKCWSRFGNRECMVNSNRPTYSSAYPVNVSDSFYERIVDATTTTDKVTSEITSALAFFGAGKSQETTRYSVKVNPKQFERVSQKAIDGLLDMVVTKINSKK